MRHSHLGIVFHSRWSLKIVGTRPSPRSGHLSFESAARRNGCSHVGRQVEGYLVR